MSTFFSMYIKSIEDRLSLNPIYMIGTLKCRMVKIAPITTSDIESMRISVEKELVGEYPNIEEIFSINFKGDGVDLTARLVELGITWDTVQELSCIILGSILDYVTKHNYKADVIENLGAIG